MMSKASQGNINNVEDALGVLFHAAQPSPAFIDRLERELNQQARRLTQVEKTEKIRRFPGWLNSVGQSAAWIGAGFLLVALMSWALTNLLPQPESQAISPYPAPEVIPTLIVTSPGLPLPPPSETPLPPDEELEQQPAPEAFSDHPIVFSIAEEIVHLDESGPGAYTFRIDRDGSFWLGSTNPSGPRILKFSEDGELLLDISLDGIEADRFDLALSHTSLWVLVLEPSPHLLRYTRMDLPGYNMEAIPDEVITLPPDLQVETGLSGVSYQDRSGIIIELQGGLRRYRYNNMDGSWIVQRGTPAILRPDDAYYQFYDPAAGDFSTSPGGGKLLILYSEAGEPRRKAHLPTHAPNLDYSFVRDLVPGYDGRLYMLARSGEGGLDVRRLHFSGVTLADEIPNSIPYLNRLAASAYEIYPSPSGDFAVEVITAGVPELEIGIHYDRIVLIRPNRLPWVIAERLEHPQKGFPYLSHFQWSPDERYVYFYSTAYASPIGTPFDMELHRLEASTGRVEPIPLPGSGRISISPDASKVVYSGDGTLHLVDLETFETESAAFDLHSIYWHISKIAWAPESDMLLFSVLQDAANWDVTETSAVFFAELQPLRLTKLLDYDERWLTVHSWIDQYPVLKSEREEGWYYVDPSTGRLTPAEAIYEEDSQAASHLLQFFFNSLWNRDYETSVERYGGSYEILQDWNPELAPDDHAGLLKNGCEKNGLECLPLRRIVEENWVSPDEIRFIVEFLNPDGSRLERGGCCGASLEDSSIQTQFEYTVKQIDGRWKVMDLPPYLP
jgi:hypothetical protein